MTPRLLAVALAIVACSAPPAKPTAPPAADAAFAAEVERFFTAHLAFRPQLAIGLGLHDHDGRVPDRSRTAIEAEIQRLRAAQATFEAIDAARLSPMQQVEREVVLAEVRKELFELAVRARPSRDPVYYLFGFSLNPYIARDYAPAAQRARSMLDACRGAGTYYQQAAANLDEKLPRPFIGAATQIGQGVIGFLRGDAKQAFANLPDATLRGELDACLDRLASQVGEFLDGVKGRLASATDDFRLGGDNLVAMLKATEGIEVDLATLTKIANDDLARNRAAILEAARQIDPSKDAAKVIAEVTADKPAPDRVIAEATEQVAKLRTFLVDRKLVSLPRADVIEVRESPPFMRGNFAALGGVGPFEQAALPSFYYISPPDPTWPPAQQQAYVMSRHDLLFTSVHEVYPGHFVQGMHQRASGSRVLAAFETYTASEGWAHYTEQMMWEQGLGDRDPRVHIGQLKNALLRDVRFLVALGYHAGTMTPEEATRLFVDQAFADLGNAKQQALRGTIDPMFLGYTLGKLVILELREDWQRANPARTLGDFHDEFLRYGEAPLPVTRRMMLGPGAKPPLSR